MKETLNKLRTRVAEDRGFTLIELLVVVVIIGVLVAIAIPVYLNYREGAANKAAQSDVRGAITAIEQFYTDNGNQYPDTTSGTGPTSLALSVGGAGTGSISVSPSVTLHYVRDPADASVYWICSKHSGGDDVYLYKNTTGGAVRTTASSLDDCAANGA